MFRSFTHRAKKLERLDTGDYTEDEYELWLREMRWINRLLGDSRALKLSIRDSLDEDTQQISVLDVGAGCGELLRKIAVATTQITDRVHTFHTSYQND